MKRKGRFTCIQINIMHDCSSPGQTEDAVFVSISGYDLKILNQVHLLYLPEIKIKLQILTTGFLGS